MQVQANPTIRGTASGVNPWLLLTGGSVGLLAGLAADLLRMGLHRARGALQALRTEHCPGGCG
jgi:hypothetical protein